MDDNETPDQDETAEESEPRVVTLGWQVIALPVLAFVVLAAFYVVGRGSGGLGGGMAPAVTVVPNATAEAMAALAQQQQQQPQIGGTGVQPLPEAYHPMKDTKAPDFEMALLDGTTKVKLSDYHGKPVMINFWATWCPPCRYEMPWVKSVYERYKDKGLVVLGVDAGEKVAPETVKSTVESYVSGEGLPFPILVDPATYQIQSSWGVYGLPSTFLINPKGTIVDVHTGMYPNEDTLDFHVQRIMPGGELAQAEPANAAAAP